MKSIDSKPFLFEALKQGAVVLTPNNRLSHALLKEFYAFWDSPFLIKPACLPYNHYLTRIFNSLNLPRKPLLLSEHQCRHLWQSFLTKNEDLFYSEGLLNRVMDAWKICLQWQITPEDPNFAGKSQTRLFQQWYRSLEQQLLSQNALSPHHLSDYLLTQRNISLPRQVIWVCFDEFTPQQRALQDFFIKEQVEQFNFELKLDKALPVQQERVAAKDKEDELDQMLDWLEGQLQSGHKKIGVVIPDLQNCYAEIARKFEKKLTSDTYTFSLGYPLTQYPLITHALKWLELDLMSLSPEDARLLLQSPYLAGSQQEFESRSQLLEDSKVLNQSQLSWLIWQKELKTASPILAERLQTLPKLPERASISEWSVLLQERLTHLGFPGEYGLDSENYQCYQQLVGLFNQFQTLAVLTPVLTLAQVVTAIKDLAQHTIFQPQSPDTPVLVSGILEASGHEYDCLWIMGLTDQCLPQASQLNPFLPKSLQLELNMPHSSAEKELHLGQKLMHRFFNSSAVIVCSYPKMTEDTPNLPSPLIRHLPVSIEYPKELITAETFTSGVKVKEDYKLKVGEDELVKGGTRLLADQAKCPFRAFAAHRLQAQKTEESSDGMNPRLRGQLLHKVLEILWQDLQSQSTLLSLDSEALASKITEAIKSALKTSSDFNFPNFQEILEGIEVARLQPTIERYLDWEKSRPPFVVEVLEKNYETQLGGLSLKVRVDRIDKDEFQNQWVIDYKTTLPSPKPWHEERPTEPQMLLYALLDEAITDLLFVEVKPHKPNIDHFEEGKIKNEQSWEELKAVWKERLETLANEFLEGHCPPQPIQASVCQQCDFNSLCRFNFEV